MKMSYTGMTLQQFLKDCMYEGRDNEKIERTFAVSGKTIIVASKLDPYFDKIIEIIPLREVNMANAIMWRSNWKATAKTEGTVSALINTFKLIGGSNCAELWLIMDALGLRDLRKEIWVTNEPYDLHPHKDKFVDEVRKMLQNSSSDNSNGNEEAAKYKKMYEEEKKVHEQDRDYWSANTFILSKELSEKNEKIEDLEAIIEMKKKENADLIESIKLLTESPSVTESSIEAELVKYKNMYTKEVELRTELQKRIDYLHEALEIGAENDEKK